MPSCLGCGEGLVEISRKIIKGEVVSGKPNFKAVYKCENDSCAQKGLKKSFLDDGLLFIPLPDGQNP
jgi:hypothetical protein